MMCVDVLKKYNAMVSFPITPKKIAAEGYDVSFYLSRLINELDQCEDRNNPIVQRLVGMAEDVMPV